MAKSKREDSRREVVREYFKENAPRVFEREPVKAYGEGALNDFVDGLLELL